MNLSIVSRTCMRGLLLRVGALAVSVACVNTAHGQEAPVWKFRFGGGVLVSSGRDTPVDADRRLTLDRVGWPVVTIDAVRSLECCLELFVSGLLASIPATLTVKDREIPTSRLDAMGVQVGLNYRWRRHDDLQFFAGPFVGAFTRERAVGKPPDDNVAVSLRETVGFGINAGVSKVVRRRALPDDDTPERRKRRIIRDEWIVIDGSVRWQRATLLTGDIGRIGWNPLIITAGLTIHLW